MSISVASSSISEGVFLATRTVMLCLLKTVTSDWAEAHHLSRAAAGVEHTSIYRSGAPRFPPEFFLETRRAGHGPMVLRWFTWG
jgi:hypothetical protein